MQICYLLKNTAVGLLLALLLDQPTHSQNGLVPVGLDSVGEHSHHGRHTLVFESHLKFFHVDPAAIRDAFFVFLRDSGLEKKEGKR